MANSAKLFFSHASRNKAIVRDIRKNLPPTIQSWLDETNLIWGDSLEPAFERTIRCEMDYVAIVLDEAAARSAWVHKELGWAIEKQRELGRTIILPISFYADWRDAATDFPELFAAAEGEPKFIQIHDATELECRRVAEEITSQIIALQHAELARMRSPVAKRTNALDTADAVIDGLAILVGKELFAHREDDPVDIETLRLGVQLRSGEKYEPQEFERLLNRIVDTNRLVGLRTDGFTCYLAGEQLGWKEKMNVAAKQAIARSAARMIRSGMHVYLDAGTTTAEIAKIVCSRIRSRSLAGLTVTTPSVGHADTISRFCVEQGFDDEYTAVDIFVPGGRIRPGTQAILPLGEGERHEADESCEPLYDIAFMGASGVSLEGGIATQSGVEAGGKRAAVRAAKLVVAVCDSSKFGVVLGERIAELGDERLRVVTDDLRGAEDSVFSQVAAELGSRLSICKASQEPAQGKP